MTPPPAQDSPDVASLTEDIRRHILSNLGNDLYPPDPFRYFSGLAHAIRDRLIRLWLDTQASYYDTLAKRVYYLSMEFLPGRFLLSSITNMGLTPACRQVAAKLGYTLEDLAEEERDAGLGNGGLGRLASCYMDSMATCGIPGYGYGILYDYGLFHQVIVNGWQEEQADNWRRQGSPWVIDRVEHLYEVRFYGRSEPYRDPGGALRYRWVDTDSVMAMPCDILIPGYGGKNVINMRLWAATSSREFSLRDFNQGDFVGAMQAKILSENISKVLYPNDEPVAGKELRLKQQYFLVAATLRDIIRRHRQSGPSFAGFADQVAIQLNDTHPTIAVAELMRILIDEEYLAWDEAWDICRRTFAYTNHTVLPEALETWPLDLLGRVAAPPSGDHPRDRPPLPGDRGRALSRRRGPGPAPGHRRPGRLPGAHGPSGHRRQPCRQRRGQAPFDHFAREGVSGIRRPVSGQVHQRHQRRHAQALAAPGQSRPVAADRYGRGTGLGHGPGPAGAAVAPGRGRRLRGGLAGGQAREQEAPGPLRAAQDRHRPQPGLAVRRPGQAHARVQAPALKRPARGHALQPPAPRSGPGRRPAHGAHRGKAAPGYFMAKRIIRLITAVAEVVNTDDAMKGRLRLVFLPNYCVSQAEKVIPAADLSEQISTAGMEASGTGNMKFALNGALTIGTLDGANVEIMEAVGPDNIFIFGLTTPEVEAARAGAHDPRRAVAADGELAEVLDMIGRGYFTPDEPDLFAPGPGRPARPRRLLLRHGRLPGLHRGPGAGRRPLPRLRGLDGHVHPQHGPHGLFLQRPGRARIRRAHLAHPAARRGIGLPGGNIAAIAVEPGGNSG